MDEMFAVHVSYEERKLMPHLDNHTVAFLLTDGYEDSELTSPWKAVIEAGGAAKLVSPAGITVTGAQGHVQTVDISLDQARPEEFDALVLPGGVTNADDLRTNSEAQRFARAFFEQHKPVGVICHGGWLLIEAGVVSGRKMTSFPSLRTDLENAGAHWEDTAVVVDNGFVSSRTPDDLPDFNRKLVEEIGEGRHREQRV